MKKFGSYITCFVFVFCFFLEAAQAQPRIGNRNIPRIGGGGGGGSSDSLERRNKNEDSITINYRYLDSFRYVTLDTSINDFYKRFPVPPTYHYLGNPGNAATPIVFSPAIGAGFDPGFHAFDVYKWKPENVRFFNTTRPYTELGYVLGSQTQQLVDIIHTQNLKPYWNIVFQYRLINSPGFFKNQKSNHNNLLFTSWYESPNKRYNNYVVLIGNKLQSAENGGIKNDQDYLNDPVFDDRFGVPTKIGSDTRFQRDPFSSDLATGNRNRENYILLRQQYDFGRKDSLVTDSTVIPLFFPRVRFEHTLKTTRFSNEFRDMTADSAYYADFYKFTLPNPQDTVSISESWRELSNDFSIYQYPDAKNLQQFLKAGIEAQLLKGRIKTGTKSFYNLIAHGEYRNRTRNTLWDAEANGKLWLNGYNAGDYHAYISLQRLISSKIGSLKVGFENINRSPSFIFDDRSNFYLAAPKSFNKENTIHLFATANNPALKLQLGANYFLISNYLYYGSFYEPQQEGTIFNVLRFNASKTFRLGRHFNWYSDVYLQQKAGNADLNIPLIFTRNRIMFEGTLGFRNLRMAAGTEFRYHTPYKANHYSPVLSQFVFQDTTQIYNRPDIHAFVHLRIRSFKAYARVENLNTLRFENGVGFKKHNFAAPDYPYPGLVMRFGVYWSFVN
ncbi:MAG: putative porin [Chitinophagaceae bacterium]